MKGKQPLLLDRLAIIELLGRVEMAVERGDGAGFADGFTSHGVFESPSQRAVGREALAGMVDRMQASGFLPGVRQFLGPIAVEVDGDTARAEACWWIARLGGGQPEAVATGAYLDELHRVAGSWRIAHRRHVPD